MHRPGHRTEPWVFAVEDTSIQLTWSVLDRDVVRAHAGAVTRPVAPDGGPGSLVVDDLPAGSLLDVALEREDGSAAWTSSVHTLTPPPGPECFRFSTMSDLHLGEEHFGFWGTIAERPRPSEPYSVRATRAALAEMRAWGSELLVLKGDLTDSGQPEQWDRIGELVGEAALPVLATPGNHDGIEDLLPVGWRRVMAHVKRPKPRTAITPAEGLERIGLQAPGRVQVRDVPGLRIVLVDTTVPHLRTGQLDGIRPELVAALAEAPGPVWVGLHHQLMTTSVPTYLPAGIARAEAVRFLDSAVAANPALLVTSGHTHRHRRRRHGPATITEVGSPKDFPGTWAGYVVHQGGIRQVVRRVAAPDVLSWTDHSASAALGLWGRWSPGQLHDRCFTHTWAAR